MIDEIFDKIVYESENFALCQRKIDSYLEQQVFPRLQDGQISEDDKKDIMQEVVYTVEKELFAVGFRYGMNLSKECQSLSDNIDNF